MTLRQVAMVLRCDPKTVQYHERKALRKLLRGIQRDRLLVEMLKERSRGNR